VGTVVGAVVDVVGMAVDRFTWRFGCAHAVSARNNIALSIFLILSITASTLLNMDTVRKNRGRFFLLNL
jgi:hypothetical protein